MQFLLYVYQWKSLPDISSAAENIITYIQCCHTVRSTAEKVLPECVVVGGVMSCVRKGEIHSSKHLMLLSLLKKNYLLYNNFIP
jgi:hypothetical protein